MATAKQILDKAVSFIGTKDNGNNKVIFNKHYYGTDVSGSAYPWCCAFVWDIFRLCDASNLFYNGQKTASCTTLMNGMKSQKVTSPKPGDLVLFNFSKGCTASIAEHIGIFEKTNSDGTYSVIEGNTSDANNTNGGYVLRRTRRKSVIVCFIRPKYDADSAKFKKDGALYNYAWKDPVGGASKPVVKLKKGAKVEWIYDDQYGWSRVKYNGKTYYCLNSRLDKSGLSACPNKTLTKNITANKISDNKITEKKTIKKGEKIKVICEIESGKYKGYSYIKRCSTEKYFYVKL